MSDSYGRGQINVVRLVLLGAIMLSIVLIYTFRLYVLQVVNLSVYQDRAMNVLQRSIPIPATRGEIYDRNFTKPLATNIISYAIDIIPGEIPHENIEQVFENLSNILELDTDEIKKKVPSQMYSVNNPIEIKDRISYETIVRISERIEDFTGVSWRKKPIRDYVDGNLMPHILGYVGNISKEQAQILFNQGYNNNSVIGQTGIEKQYDLMLRGEDGKQFRTVDAKGHLVRVEDENQVDPINGSNIVLTVDRDIQLLAQKSLGKRIGSVVVLKPSSGEILSMVSYPTYNPNIFTQEELSSELAALNNDDRYPFLNRPIQSTYAPASTWKLLMGTAIVAEDIISLDETIQCDGWIEYGDRIFRCWDRDGQGPLNFYEAIAQSCDIYFYEMGREHLHLSGITEYSNFFGIGQLTGIDIPGEVSGRLPSDEWKRSRFNGVPWLGGDTVNMSIGQGYLELTPLQVAQMVAMIVNEGYTFKPHLLKERRDNVSGMILESIEPELLLTTSIDQKAFKEVKIAMREVVTNGSGRWTQLSRAVQTAGKTGTAEVGIKGKYHSWYVAYAPYDAENPDDQVVVVTMVEARNEYETWAPKAANLILHGIFKDMTYEEVIADMRPYYLAAPEVFE